MKISKFIGEVTGELRKAKLAMGVRPQNQGPEKVQGTGGFHVVVLIAMVLLAGFVKLLGFNFIQSGFFLDNFVSDR